MVGGNGYVPDMFTYDYKLNYNLATIDVNNLPRKYDSRDVNGSNYVTPLKKQFSNLCWDFAFTSVIETKLLKSGLETNPSSLDLSERVMDYATSDPVSAIDIGENPYYSNYPLNSLSESGNEYRYSSALINGVFPINESYWDYDKEYMGKVKSEDIFDFNKIDYQVNEVIYFDDNNLEVGFDEETNKLLKKYIIENGSVGFSLRVGAGGNNVRYKASEDEKLNSGESYNVLYYKAPNALYLSNDHTVSIIGWDDDYVRNICVLDDGKLKDAVNVDGSYSCSEGILKTINGAWITKDSSSSLYHYASYETVKSNYFAVRDISRRDFDNVYPVSSGDTVASGEYIFKKQNNIEKIKSIKFYSQTIINRSK